MIPFAGMATTGAKLANKAVHALKHVDEVAIAAKFVISKADDVYKFAKNVGKHGDDVAKLTSKVINKADDVVKGVDKMDNISKAARSVENTLEDAAKKSDDVAKGVTKQADSVTYQTYTKTNPNTGEVYSGRTSGTKSPLENVANRDRKHHMNDQGFGPAELDVSSSNKDAIRGREQQLIDMNGGAKSQGGTSGNAINSIRDGNPKRAKYIREAEKEFGKL